MQRSLTYVRASLVVLAISGTPAFVLAGTSENKSKEFNSRVPMRPGSLPQRPTNRVNTPPASSAIQPARYPVDGVRLHGGSGLVPIGSQAVPSASRKIDARVPLLPAVDKATVVPGQRQATADRIPPAAGERPRSFPVPLPARPKPPAGLGGMKQDDRPQPPGAGARMQPAVPGIGAQYPSQPSAPGATRPTPVPLPELPDLIVRRFEMTGRLQYDAATNAHIVPVSMMVANVGHAPAGPSDLVAQGDSPAGRSTLNLLVDGQPVAVGYGTVNALRPGESRILTGNIFLPPQFQGQRVSLTAIADGVSGREFVGASGRVRESNEDNNISRPIVLEIPLAVRPLPTTASVGVAENRSSPSERWHIGLNNITIRRSSEGSGDEPYFICYGFRAQFGVEGSARVFRQGRPYEFKVDSRTNVSLPVPRDMTTVTFDNVRRITWNEYQSTPPEFIGVIFVAMEHDASDFGDIETWADRGIEPLRREVERLIAQAQITRPNADDAIDSAIGRVTDAVTPNLLNVACWKLLENSYNPIALAQVLDPDNVIGVHVAAFLAADDDWEADADRGRHLGFFQVPRLSNTNWTVNFAGTEDDHCDWQVEGFAVKSARPSRP